MKRSADVVIVGGGCMGASVAYHLTRRGITDIVLVEREQIAGQRPRGRMVDHLVDVLIVAATSSTCPNSSAAMFDTRS